MPNDKKFNPPAYYKKMKLLTNADGTIKKSVQNIFRVLRDDPALKQKIRLNNLDGRIHISADVPWDIPSTRVDADGTAYFSEFDEARLYLYIVLEIIADRDITKKFLGKDNLQLARQLFEEDFYFSASNKNLRIIW